MHKSARRYIMKKYKVILTESEMRKLNEVRRNDGDDEFITVDYIDKSNYKKYIGRKVNVTGNVDLNYLRLKRLSIIFGTVDGYFDCSYSNLISLKGCPRTVGGDFNCSFNNLISLKGCPRTVGGDFNCSHDNLTSLEGCPIKVDGDFDCRLNEDKFTEADVKRLCKVGGDIMTEDD
jgi:hypothetical protein